MSNLVLTSNPTTVKVAFNDLAQSYTEAVFKRTDIYRVQIDKTVGFVRVVMTNGESFDLCSKKTNGAMVVDTIDGIAPTSNSDLMNKIVALIL